MNKTESKRWGKRIDSLVEALRHKGSIAVSFSGGADSSLLAMLAHRALGQKALAITIDSPLLTSVEIDDARKIANDIGIEFLTLELNELDIPGFRNNPPQRCYLCKSYRFEKLKDKASELGFITVADGTTFSDLDEYRPGLKAAKEMDIYSPLMDAGLSKEAIRVMGNLLGLRAASKPANSCLASRIPYGQPIEPAKLERIARAEGYIRTLTGVKVLRVRDHGDLARIECGQDEINLLLEEDVMHRISQKLKSLGYEFVTLDIEGYRSGGYDRKLQDKH